MRKQLLSRWFHRLVSKSLLTKRAKSNRLRAIALEGLEHKHLMASDLFLGDALERQLTSPPDVDAVDVRFGSDISDREALDTFSKRTLEFAKSLDRNSTSADGGYSSALATVATNAAETNSLNAQEVSDAAWEDWSSNIAKAEPSVGGLSSVLAPATAVRQITSAWPSNLNSDLGREFLASPFRNGSNEGNTSAGFDPSSIWMGANINSSPSTNALFQPIASGTDVLPVDLSRFIGSKAATIAPFVDENGATSEGEGDTPTSPLALPAQGLPTLQLAGAGFRIDQYTPSFTSSGNTSDFVGAFSEQTTPENADLTQPGLSWVHSISRTWNSATQWSITETFVMAFNASISTTITNNLVPETSTDTTRVATHTVSGTGIATLTAGRSTSIIVTIHAERGITTDPAAGVAWSIHSSSKDTRTLGFIASITTNMEPNPDYVDPTWRSDGSVEGRTADPNGPIPVPRNLRSGMSISAGFNIGVSTGGSLDVSGTPSIVPDASRASGSDIETEFRYGNHRLSSIDLGLTSGFGYNSSSGNINSVVPILGFFDDSQTAGLRLVADGGNRDIPIGDPPIHAPTTGVGHSFAGSSNTNSNTRSSGDQRISMQGRMRSDGRLTALSGDMRNKMEDKLSQSGDNNSAQVLRHFEGDQLNGFSSTIVAGRNVKGKAAANAEDTFGASVGLDSSNEASFSPNQNKTEIDVDGGNSSVNFEYVTTSGWGHMTSPAGSNTWSATQTDNQFKRQYEKLEAEAIVENITSTSGTAHREGAQKSLQSTSYSNDLTVVNFFPESPARSDSGGPAFEKITFKNRDSWSMLQDGEGAIDSTLGADGEVHSTGGSSGSATESFSYSADSSFVRQYILPEVEDRFNDVRFARYNQTARATASFDPNNPNATDPPPTISGDDRVIVTGVQSHINQKKIFGMPMVTSTTRILETGWTTVTSTIHMMGVDGDDFGGPISDNVSYFEPNWDPRSVYESGLDGIPLPEGRRDVDGNLTREPAGYVDPSSIGSSGRTWMDYLVEKLGGKRGDAFDQQVNFASGFGDNLTLGASAWFRSHNPFLGDYVDYEGTSYFIGDMAANFVPGPTSIAKKGTMVWKLYNQYDDAGRCASIATKLIQGGCFVAGTPVTVSSLPGTAPSIDSHWSDPSWLDAPSHDLPWLTPDRYSSVATRTEQLVPIETLPIGARVPTKNPNRWEVDPQPEPDQHTWAKLSITVERSDGGIVDAELIRPRAWILANGICAGRLLPLNLPELDVSGLALVTAIDDCPPIADGEGEGSVVTARFVTREVHVVASVDVLGADGTVETTTGTTIHPIWSVDRQEWVPLGELIEGETLQGLDGLAVVLSVTLSRVLQPVYNIEVHGEHVYQVGELGLLVHNACPVGGIAGTRGLQHSFDSHAAQWFARHGGTPSIAKWQELIETASKSTKVVDWSTGADKTIGKLARIDGNKWFFVQFFKEGSRAGELATAFIPNADQLGAILRLIGK